MPYLRSLFLQTNRIFYTLPPEVEDLSNAAIMYVFCHPFRRALCAVP